MSSGPYTAHERLVAPARVRAAPWRLVAGLGLVAVLSLGLNMALHNLLFALSPDRWGPQAMTGETPATMLVLLSGFGFVTLATLLAARLLHSRNPLGLIGPLPLVVSQFWRVFRMLILIGLVVLLLPPYDMGPPLQRNLPTATWAMLLPVSLIAVLIQTSAEEILFRGYLQQGLAARFSSPVVWIGIPSLLFALGHYAPAEAGDNALIIALWSGLFALLMADLTARAGSLGPAIAVHLFNNVAALLFFALPDSLNGLSLFILPFNMSDTGALRTWLAADFAMMLISWLAARIAIRR